MVEKKRTTTKYAPKNGGSTAKNGGSTAKKGGSSCKKGGSSCKKGGDVMNNVANLSVPFGLILAQQFLKNVDALKPTSTTNKKSQKTPSRKR